MEHLDAVCKRKVEDHELRVTTNGGEPRVGEIRVFYDVVQDEVHVIAIMTKARAIEWLNGRGIRE